MQPGIFVTGVGSLPHRSVAAAVRFVARHAPEVPFWPQLPQRAAGEGMLAQCFPDLLHGEPGSLSGRLGDRAALLAALADPVALTPDRAGGLWGFAQAVRHGAFPAAVALKGQLVGPITAAAALPGGVDCQDAELLRAIARRIVGLARQQLALLPDHLPRLLVLDEPVLGLLPERGRRAPLLALVLGETLAAIRRPGVLVGVHCCSQPPMDLLGEIDPDLISFDAHAGLETFLADPAAGVWLRRSRLLAPGIVPTVPTATLADAPHLADRLIAAVRALPPDQRPRTLLLSPSCGLSSLALSAAARTFQVATRIAERAREFLPGIR